MINFKGTPPILKSAEMLEVNARNLYPHISTSKIKTFLDADAPRPQFYRDLNKKLKFYRKMIKESEDVYSTLVYALQESKIGNCTEDAIFTQLLGRINGQKNIYAGGIFFSDGETKSKLLDHAVAFITNKKIKNNKEYFFKNKDAIIIDPWLGITDFASSYFTKVKTIFGKMFKALPNNDFAIGIAKFGSKNYRDFNKCVRDFSTPTHFSIIPFIDNIYREDSIKELKELFPELTIAKYKTINISKRKK